MIWKLRGCNILRKTESPTARADNTVCEHQGSVNRKNLVSVHKRSSSARLFPVPKSLFLNTCSLDKIKNRVQASVALAADFQSWDIDIGVISEMHLCRQKPINIVAIEGYTTYRVDGDWAETDKKQKKGGVAVNVRENLKVLNFNCAHSFKMLSVELLHLSGHHMLITGLYHPPSLKYDEGNLIDTIINCCDTFLDMHSNGVVLCGGDLNQLDLHCLSTSPGLVPMVNFTTRGPSTLDNCLTNHPELFNDPLRFQALIKTDNWGVILPLGNKIKPIQSKSCFRDFREHHKIKFTSEIVRTF